MSPSLRFRGQPFEQDQAAAFLDEVLVDESFHALTIVVAWARFGGLRRFAERLEAFRARGARLEIILGIDEGVATWPGLRLVADVADAAHVFHDPGSRTFHPKLYLAEGPARASLMVGSSNMTVGGLFSNYEATLQADFELPAEDGDEALGGARAYVRRLLEDRELCRPLDAELLARLRDHPRYPIAANERRIAGEDGPAEVERGEEDGGGLVELEAQSLFGASMHEKAPVPGLPPGADAELAALEAESGRDREGSQTGARRSAGLGVVVERWTKILPKSDAQHPPGSNSNPLGNLRLTKAGHEIDWLTYFRNELFGPAAWLPRSDRRGNRIEVATIPFDVTVDGRALGIVELAVDHAPHREEGQHNHATVLHWGPLTHTLRETDYTGHTVAIERHADGGYTLEILP